MNQYDEEMTSAEIENHHEWATRKTEEARRKAYADPLTGSDPLFAQVVRMEAMSEEGVEEVKQKACDRYEEIKARHPWPSDPQEPEPEAE